MDWAHLSHRVDDSNSVDLPTAPKRGDPYFHNCISGPLVPDTGSAVGSAVRWMKMPDSNSQVCFDYNGSSYSFSPVVGVAFYHLLSVFYPHMLVEPDWLLGLLFGAISSLTMVPPSR
ncbi:MAG: hypothetical protein KFF68_08085 [Desulfosarcina sp.]|nr:hypothetical protein [Desulfosarcina sp.]